MEGFVECNGANVEGCAEALPVEAEELSPDILSPQEMDVMLTLLAEMAVGSEDDTGLCEGGASGSVGQQLQEEKGSGSRDDGQDAQKEFSQMPAEMIIDIESLLKDGSLLELDVLEAMAASDQPAISTERCPVFDVEDSLMVDGPMEAFGGNIDPDIMELVHKGIISLDDITGAIQREDSQMKVLEQDCDRTLARLRAVEPKDEATTEEVQNRSGVLSVLFSLLQLALMVSRFAIVIVIGM